MYDVYKDNIFIISGNWTSGDSITIDLNGLSAGVYDYKIIVHNGQRSVENIITVTVISIPYGIEISHPPDITYYERETGHYIRWVINNGYEENAHYSVYSDIGFIESGSWEKGMDIAINVDGLSVGDHFYRIQVHNSYETVSDQVNVKVLPASTGISGFSLVFLLFFIFITISVLRKKMLYKK